jgi:type I restriction enzyme S subunit
MSKNKLRFKDVNGNSYTPWVNKKLVEEATVYQPQTISQKQFTETGYPVFGANGVIGTYKEYNHLMPQIALSCRGNAGTINLTPEKSWITGNAMVINIDENTKINKLFLLNQLKSYDFRSIVTGSGQPQITRASLNNVEIVIPSLPEQEKIASLFSKLDERIELREHKIASLKEYKKGLQQAIFGNNGERTLRFKDKNGNDYPSHNELLLGEVSSIKTGKKDANAMSDNGEYAFFTCSRQNYKINNYSFDGKALLIAGNGDVGHIKYYEGKFDAYQRTYVVQDFNNIDPIYLKNFLDAKLPLRIAAEMQSGAMPYIKLGTLSEMPVAVPSLPEQEKIAALFSKIDSQIELEEALLQSAKDEKQGLMKRVF